MDTSSGVAAWGAFGAAVVLGLVAWSLDLPLEATAVAAGLVPHVARLVATPCRGTSLAHSTGDAWREGWATVAGLLIA